MNYIVLARKWRPQNFSQVVAQQHVVRAIQNAIKLDRLPHAILLTGSRGVGKTTIARLIAKTVNCEKLKENIDDSQLPNPCNSCTNCLEITEGRSIDVIEIDGASNRSIDDIRELRDNVQYLPTKARRKVYIIDEVHMLTREAFNALLKTLEEPPKHVLFIFATTEPNKIPITILSRCQRFDFKRIPNSELKRHLKNIASSENIQLSDRSISIIARAAQGGMRDALSLLDQVISFAGTSPSEEEVAQAIGIADRNQLIQLLEYIVSADIHNALKSTSELLSTAYDIRQLTADLAELIRDLMVVSLSPSPLELTELSEEEVKILKNIAENTDQHRIYQMFKILSRSAEEIAKSNYPELLLDMTVIQMARSYPLVPLNDAIKYLRQLEKNIADLLKDPSFQTATKEQDAITKSNIKESSHYKNPTNSTEKDTHYNYPTDSYPIRRTNSTTQKKNKPNYTTSLNSQALPKQKEPPKNTDQPIASFQNFHSSEQKAPHPNQKEISSTPKSKENNKKKTPKKRDTFTEEKNSIDRINQIKEENGLSKGKSLYISPTELEKKIDLLWTQIANELLEKIKMETGSDQVLLEAAIKTAKIKIERERLSIIPAMPNNTEILRRYTEELETLYKIKNLKVIIEIIESSQIKEKIPGLLPSIEEREKKEERQKLKQLQKEVENHPLIKSILKSAPRAKIIKVKPIKKN